MKRIVKTISIVFLFLFFASPSVAEDMVSLDEAIGIALKENNHIKAMSMQVESGVKGKHASMGSLFPKVSFEERYMATNNPTYSFMSVLNQERITMADFDPDKLNDPDTIENYQTVVSVEQPIFAKKAYVAMDIAKDSLEASKMELGRTKEEVLLQVIQTYINVVTSKEYHKVALKGVEDAQEHHRIAKLRFDSGLGLYSDVLRAEVAVFDAERAVVEAEKMESVSKRMLGLLLGRNTPVDTEETVFMKNEAGDEHVYLESAKERYDLKAMESKVRTAGHAVKLAEADYYPEIGIRGAYELNDHEQVFGSEGESWQVMAFMRVNIFDGLVRENTRSKASYEERSAHEQLNALRKKIDFEVHEALLTVQETKKKLILAESSVRSAEEGIRLVEKRYENSLAPIVSLLDAQVALDKARAEAVAMRGKHHISLMKLEFVSGRLLSSVTGGV
jgi:outer membrane protein